MVDIDALKLFIAGRRNYHLIYMYIYIHIFIHTFIHTFRSCPIIQTYVGCSGSDNRASTVYGYLLYQP